MIVIRGSRGEIKIEEILQAAGLKFIPEYSFKDLVSSSGRPLRFDFAVFDDDDELDFLIEFQGIQHYQAKSKFGGKSGLYKQKYNDTQKRKYCMQKGYKLIEIPYTDEARVDYNYIMIRAGY